MDSLKTLIDLQKARVDEQRIVMTRLNARLDMIEQQIAELEIRKVSEQTAASENQESRTTYGAFLDHAKRQGLVLERERQATLSAIEAARAVLAELFEEQKRYEIAQNARELAALKEEKRKESIELDEMGAVTHERKKDTSA